MDNDQLEHQQLPQKPLQENSADDVIDLREIFGILWAEKWVVIISTLIAIMASVAYALIQPNIYRAEATLAEAGARQSTSPLAGQLGSAAALIGIDLPMGQNSGRVGNAIALMQSRDFIIRFIHKYDALVPLFAGKWNADTQTSYIDSNIYDERTGQWLSENGAPTDLQAYRAFNSLLSVRLGNIMTIAIEWHDPVQAQRWVNLLVEEINQEVKASDLAEATNAIAYLRQQLESTQLVEMQRVFYDLIESQTRVIMLADVRDEYVFQVIDPAVVPDETVSPRRRLIVFNGTMAGGMLGLLFILLKRVFRKKRVEA